jgi:RNA polymerase sigma-70 factor (ECF subfamily)
VRSVSTLFDEALPEVHGYLRRRCGSDDLAEELTAITFVRATIACGRGQVAEATIPWLITIARNLLVDHWRHRAVAERSLGLIEGRPAAADPWSAVLDARRAEELLCRVKPEHRAVLTLRYLDDLSVPEVAAVLDRSVHATESLLVRARSALRREYEASGGES